MREGARIAVVIPALNEAGAIGRVLDAIPAWVDDVVVGDNNSEDGTPGAALAHGARVVVEERRGYGSACLKAMDTLDNPDIVVFLDADFSDHPEQMDRLVDPIIEGTADMVIGSRVRGRHEPGALTLQARFGNQLACFLMRLFWGVQYTDLGPFRSIRYETLMNLGMKDPDYGWTVEMQIKAALHNVRATEVPVDYRKRIGKSKVSGTLHGVVGAGYKILGTIFLSAARYYLFLDADRDARKVVATTRERVIIFTRYPEAGKTKTRLIPALGPEGAAEFQRKMTEHAVANSRFLKTATVEVRYAGGDEALMRDWLGQGLILRDQGPGDLGEKMCRALAEALEGGAERALITGIDSPEITPGIVECALEALGDNDVVLGPATDGGYYLIGMRGRARNKALPRIFQQIKWGSEEVFEETRRVCESLRLSVFALAPLDDVDHPEDLEVWERSQRDSTAQAESPELTVIIPTLDEATQIGMTLDALTVSEEVEVFVADGGSTDGTQEIARQHGVRVFEGQHGRAAQMNFAAAKARGQVLLFVHADTRLATGFSAYAIAAVNRPGVAAGAYRFSTNDSSLPMRFMGWWANLRSRWLQLPYGDQGLFVRKDVFREVGGFPDISIMEDFALVRRLKRRGKIVLAPVAAVTSARRWQRVGLLRTFMTNQAAVLAYYLSVPPASIAHFYRRR